MLKKHPALKAPRKRVSSASPGTRDRIIDVAERLFSEYGLSGVSLRHIADEAKANNASLHYHFRSREELFEAVFTRRATVIAQRRLQLLDQAYDANGKPILSKVIGAFLEPGMKFGPDKVFMKLRARVAAEDSAFVQDLLSTCFNESSKQALDMLRQACPHLSEKDLVWRFQIMLGSMFYTIADTGRVEVLSNGSLGVSNTDDTLNYLVAFFTASFSMPSVIQADATR